MMRSSVLSLAAVAVCVLATIAPPVGAQALSPAVKAKIHAQVSPYDFFPASLPAGLQYSSSKVTQLTPMVCGPSATLTFLGSGKRIDWSTSRDCGSDGRVTCSSGGYPGYGFDIGATQQATINGRKVFFSLGNTGSNAWACIPERVGGFADIAVVGIWENFMSPQQAMALVANARR